MGPRRVREALVQTQGQLAVGGTARPGGGGVCSVGGRWVLRRDEPDEWKEIRRVKEAKPLTVRGGSYSCEKGED